LSVSGPAQSVCTTRTHTVHSTESLTSTEWNVHMTSSSAAMIVNCTSPSMTLCGEYQSVITRTWSGCRQQRTHSARCQWRHDVCSWRHGCCGLVVYINTARLTDNCCVSLSCRSTWGTCGTALKRHVVRLSSVTEARHRTSGSTRWVNCLVVSLLQCYSEMCATCWLTN